MPVVYQFKCNSAISTTKGGQCQGGRKATAAPLYNKGQIWVAIA